MRAGLGAALMFSVAIVAAAQQPGPQKSGHNNLIRGTGCVKPGVENGCTVLTDRKTGDVYTVFFSSDNLPAPNAAISFEGTAHQGMTTCMQGRRCYDVVECEGALQGQRGIHPGPIVSAAKTSA